MKSDSVKKGMQTAPQRSLFNALGLTKEELEKPLVAIVSSYNEIVPGHMNLDKIVEAANLVSLWQVVHQLYSRQLPYVMVLRWDMWE